MTIQTLYRVQCSDPHCLRYLPRGGSTRKALEDPRAAALFTSRQDAEAAAKILGWSVYPLLCPYCEVPPLVCPCCEKDQP